MTDTRYIEKLWTPVYASGIGDVQQGLILISHLLIFKQLEHQAPHDWQDDKPQSWWQTIKTMAREDNLACLSHLRGPVSQWLSDRYPDSFLCHADAVFARLVPQKIFPLMDAIDTLWTSNRLPGEVYEDILIWAAQQGIYSWRTGQVMTPMHIAHLIAALMHPQPGERIADVSCGTANLLVAALRYMEQYATTSSGVIPVRSLPDLIGYDIDQAMQVQGWTHLLLRGVTSPQIASCDTLGNHFNRLLTSGTLGKMDIVLANPPYNGVLDTADLGESLCWLNTEQTELLFIELVMQLLADRGKAALLLPDGAMWNRSAAARAVRRKLITEHRVRLVVSLPPAVFLPHANVKTSLIIFEKGALREPDVWFYTVAADGYAFDARRPATPTTNDLWDLRLLQAAVSGQQDLPSWAREQITEEQWQRYRGDPSSWYVAPVAPEGSRNGEEVMLQLQPARKQKAWRVSIEEIEAQGYRLCAQMYRQDAG